MENGEKYEKGISYQSYYIWKHRKVKCHFVFCIFLTVTLQILRNLRHYMLQKLENIQKLSLEICSSLISYSDCKYYFRSEEFF